MLGAELSPEVRAALDAAPVPEGLTVRKHGLHLVEAAPDKDHVWSDYDAFRDRKVPVLFFSDGQNVRYHTPEDDVDAVDFPKLARETEHLFEVTRSLGASEKKSTFVADGADSLRDAVSVHSMLVDALDPRGGIVTAMDLSTTAAARLRSDREAVAAVLDRLADGAAATKDDVTTLRRGAQRLMCYAAGEARSICNGM